MAGVGGAVGGMVGGMMNDTMQAAMNPQAQQQTPASSASGGFCENCGAKLALGAAFL